MSGFGSSWRSSFLSAWRFFRGRTLIHSAEAVPGSTSLDAFVISMPALPLAAWPWSKSGRGGLAEGIIGFETVGTPPRPPPSTPPSSSPWGSTHFQQEAPKVKAEDNVESLTPNYCNRIWGITAETIRCSWDAATLPAADLTYDDIVPDDEE